MTTSTVGHGTVGAEGEQQLAVLGPLTALFASFAILIVGNGLHPTLLAVRAGRRGRPKRASAR